MESSAQRTRIGVFDSGVGGLTVLRELQKARPDFDFVYLGDTARLPYGSKSPETIRRYALKNLEFLSTFSVQALVIACNSASSQVSESTLGEVPILNVIDPGVRMALAASGSQNIGVLGTRATIASGVYTKKIQARNPQAQVHGVACPLFVPLAEEGWVDDPVTNLIAYRYCASLLNTEVDAVILGCTHYPLLRTAIAKVLGGQCQLIDAAHELASELEQLFPKQVDASPGSTRLLLSDWSAHLESWAMQVLEDVSQRTISVEKVNVPV